jgi:phospholipid transport system transporter-binding protein
MTLATVAALRIEGRRAFAAASGELAVDLGGVSRADSAGLALLVDWLAWAAGAARKLHFTAVPATVAALAHLSDVENLLREGPEPSAPASTTTP